MLRKGDETEEVWKPCKSRRCPYCLNVYVGAKMEPMLHANNYALEIDKREWQALQKKMQRRREAGEYAPITRIPTSNDHIVVVSAYPIGDPIEELVIEELIRNANPAWGNITQAGWRITVVEPQPPEEQADSEWEVCGNIWMPQQQIESLLIGLGVQTFQTPRGLRWRCDDETHALIVRATDCMTERQRKRRAEERWLEPAS